VYVWIHTHTHTHTHTYTHTHIHTHILCLSLSHSLSLSLTHSHSLSHAHKHTLPRRRSARHPLAPQHRKPAVRRVSLKQKRPTIDVKETYYRGKRDLLYRKKRPIMEVKRPTMKTWRKDAHGERGGVRVDKVSKKKTSSTTRTVSELVLVSIKSRMRACGPHTCQQRPRLKVKKT
jgi:hypothetical protein